MKYWKSTVNYKLLVVILVFNSQLQNINSMQIDSVHYCLLVNELLLVCIDLLLISCEWLIVIYCLFVVNYVANGSTGKQYLITGVY